LFYLCLHGSRHCWDALDEICCVSELMRARSDIDWEYVANYAARVHCKGMLSLGVLLAHRLLQADIPTSMKQIIEQDTRSVNLAEEVCDTLFLEKTGTPLLSQRFRSFSIRAKDRFADKLRTCLNLALRPTKEDWRIFNPPGNRAFLLYLLMPMRLAAGLLQRRNSP